MRIRSAIGTAVAGALIQGASAATYYVDYDAGSDLNTGTATNAPFRFAPGDPQASGNAAAVLLTGGDTVLFKGGAVYRGSIDINRSGAPGSRITYKGDGWGTEKAVIDGSNLLTNWMQCASAEDAGGNTAYTNLFYTYLPDSLDPFLINLHEIDPVSGVDDFLWISQQPNPADFYFFDRRDDLYPVTHANLTLTSIVSPDFLTQTDVGHWDGASVLVWVNPNWTVRQDIQQFIPAENKIIFTTLDANAIYDDGRDQYFAIYNHPNAIDTPGEYAVTLPDGQGRRKIILWPRSPGSLGQRISRSERINGFDFGPVSHIEIAGFEIRKFGASGLRDGCGIQAYGGSSAVLTNIVLRDNLITHNKHATKGYGGIFANQLRDSLIESNTVVKNPLHAGIFISSCEDSIVRGNTIQYTGNTALRLYTCKRVQVLGNRINHIYSTHANGLTLYLGCYDVLAANNVITDATTPITHQNSGNLYFFNNITDGGGLYKNVNEWPLSSSGAQEHGKIVYINNTFVNADSDASLSLGADVQNEYVVLNNILDGMGLDSSKTSLLELHDYNLFTGRNWAQATQYGWTDAVHEVFVTNAFNTIFADPVLMDYHLVPGSPAADAGMNAAAYYPTNIFPDFNFTLDADGKPRISLDVGAYADDSSSLPVAAFSAVPVSGPAPLAVTFTDTSTGSITNRHWDFGDGTVTNTLATSVAHTYTVQGSYTVALIASGPAGADTNTQTDVITVTASAPPSASFSLDPAFGTAPLTVTFTDSSTGSITNRFWDFGDGSSTNTAAASCVHTYASAGTYTVQLTVSGLAGSATNTQAAAVTVTASTGALVHLDIHNTFNYDGFVTGEEISYAATQAKTVPNAIGDNTVSYNYVTAQYSHLVDPNAPTYQGIAADGIVAGGTYVLAKGIVLKFGTATGDAKVNNCVARLYDGNSLSFSATINLAAGDQKKYSDFNILVNGNRYATLAGTMSATLSVKYVGDDNWYLVWTESVSSGNGGVFGGGYNGDTGANSKQSSVWRQVTVSDGEGFAKTVGGLTVGGGGSSYMYEFATPITLDSTKVLESFKMDTTTYNKARVNDFILYAASATAVSGTVDGGTPPPPPIVSGAGNGSFGKGQDVINWTTVQGSGYVYSVWYSTNLLNGFQPLETNLPDTVQSITNTIGAPSVFYKIEAGW